MKSVEETDKEFLLNTYAKSYINFVKGENSTLFTDSNEDYIDFTSGIGVASIGHGNQELSDTISNQASKLIHTSNLFVIENQATLGQKIVELSGYDMKCFFSNSGAEANECALKIARKYGQINFDKKKYKVITLDNSFHGRTITTVKATAQSKFHTPNFSPYPDGFVYAKSIEDIYEKIDDETVGVLIELIQGEGGIEPFAKEEVQKLATSLKEQGILLIVDEVQSGVYRTGEFLASRVFGITPDIITLAKGLGGGVPIGATMTNLKDIFTPGDHGSTFGGNHLCTAVANTVIEELLLHKQTGMLDAAVKYFNKQLDLLLADFSNIFTKKVGIGLMLGLRVKSQEKLDKIFLNSLMEKVLVLKSGRGTLRFLPPLVITKEEIDLGFKRLRIALEKM